MPPNPPPIQQPLGNSNGTPTQVWVRWFNALANSIESSSGGATDHGALTGLTDDDHAQYLNNTRGDVRYYTQSAVDALLEDKADKYSTSTITSGATVTAGDCVLADASSGSIVVTLPASSTCSGETVIVKKIDSSLNTVTIDGNGSETIDGSLTAIIVNQYDAISLISNGTEWFIT